MDLIPEGVRSSLFPVGRLDLDTEGLLLITNDGEMAFRLTHPRFRIKKKYLAEVKNVPSEKDLLMFKNGIPMEEGLTSPAGAKIISSGQRKALLLISLYEGKKRQVKRMCKAIGHPVISLKRISLAFLNLHNLQPGAYRSLEHWEIQKLLNILGLENKY
jgi:23S rRNA pseudouridine2605 synthase